MRKSSGDYDFTLLEWRANSIRKAFPGAQLRLMLYEASGYYKGSGTFKESYHLVWPEAGAGREGRNHQVL